MTTEEPEVAPGRNWQGAVLAVARPSPAALVTLWGALVVVVWASPARPYSDGTLLTADLVELAVIGGIVGLLSRPTAAAIGIPLGLSAAVALQLYGLAGQAYYVPTVGSPLTASEWTTSVTGALMTGFAAVVVGYLVVRVPLEAGRIRRGKRGVALRWSGDRTGPGRRTAAALAGSLAVFALAIAVSALLVGGSLVSVAKSAFVSAHDLPTINVAIQGRAIISALPTSLPAGWARVATAGGDPQNTDLWLTTAPLSDDVLAELRGGQMFVGYLGSALLQSSGPVDLRRPGTYALVLTPFHATKTNGIFRYIGADGSWTPPPQGGADAPVSDFRLLEVTAAAVTSRSTEASGDGGRYLTFPAVAALGIEAWATAGAVLLRLSWFSRPTGRRVVGSLVVGAMSAALLGSLVAFAINLAHNPF